VGYDVRVGELGAMGRTVAGIAACTQRQAPSPEPDKSAKARR
jgi:hypothetical protein